MCYIFQHYKKYLIYNNIKIFFYKEKNGKVNYYMETGYDSEGNAISYTYYDKNKNVIDEPQEEIDAYGE